MTCPTCGSWSPFDCACVKRRTFRKVTLAGALDMTPYDKLPTVQRPRGDNHQKEPRAPRHTGGLWTCDHVEHTPTDGRGV